MTDKERINKLERNITALRESIGIDAKGVPKNVGVVLEIGKNQIAIKRLRTDLENSIKEVHADILKNKRPTRSKIFQSKAFMIACSVGSIFLFIVLLQALGFPMYEILMKIFGVVG